jgi:hypothetical protein
MGVTTGSLGGLTPICSDCGIAESFEIGHDEYDERPDYWNNWECPECIESHTRPRNWANEPRRC